MLYSLEIEEPTTAPDILSSLNQEQRQAVETTEGPLLVLAGAGTGKTRVLTTRIAHILLSGKAFPGQILAVTFTNKASREMMRRVNDMVDQRGEGIWLGTFHSIGVRILRKHAELLGLKKNFNILDEDDQLRVIKTILEEHNIDDKRWPPKVLLAIIKKLKDQAITPEKAGNMALSDFANGRTSLLYDSYQTRLKTLNVADFGDLLLHMITLFTKHPDILSEYQRRFKYILVDEYQDTNVAQYLWLRLLAQSHHNICCVGDDDQSIYGWRGAEIANILKFEKDFSGAKVIRLERNYRSTHPILASASKVISHNKERHGKTLWTETREGDAIKVVSLWDDKSEATYVADEIEALQQTKSEILSEIAVLVRAGFQTRSFEECFISRSMPYRVIGGVRFYERQEIRDIIAYIRLLVSESDDLAFNRIINVPKRGIGNATLDQINLRAKAENISLYAALQRMISERAFPSRAQSTLEKFLSLIKSWNVALQQMPHKEVVERIINESGYKNMWQSETTEEAKGRLENLGELISAVGEFESLEQFLEHVSLVTDIDNMNDLPMVTIMTLHAAKGLEFNTVFLPGWEEGLFPSQRSIDEKGAKGLEEERRLAYVGITRARKNLYISFVANRRIYNQWQNSIPSRFVDELPEDHIDRITLSGIGIKRPKENNSLRISLSSFANKSAPVYAAEFMVGTRIFHDKFGYGFIEEVSGNHLKIRFDKAGNKTLLDSFVKKAS